MDDLGINYDLSLTFLPYKGSLPTTPLYWIRVILPDLKTDPFFFTVNLIHYNLLMNTRVANKRTNLGKTYLLKINTSVTNIANANTTWLIKKKGTNWGMVNKVYII